MQRRREKRKNALRAVLWAWGVLVACLLVFLSSRTDRAIAATEPARTYDIGSAEDFAIYSEAYNAGLRNPGDVLNISIQAGLTVTDRNFISLGTEDRPFAGTLNIPTSGIDVFHLFECPLFDYVSTDLKVTGGGTIKIMREEILETPPVGTPTRRALFANHVVAGSDSANWSVTLLPLTEGTEATYFEGLIGEIADGCTVTVTFTNNANLAISGPENTGTVCGTLGEDASLTVTTAGSGSALSVTSTGGHAGGVVGFMGEGATLTLNSANNTRVNAVTSSSGYAGGIVGYVDHATASTGVKLGGGVSDYAVSGRVTGTSGAGGLFGYYGSYADGVTFDLNGTYSVTSGTRVASSGNTGGLFGYLNNQGGGFTFDGNASGGETLTVSLTSGSARGGIAGRYSAGSLTGALTLTDTRITLTANSTAAGGLIGVIADVPTYVAITEVDVTSAGTSAGNAPGGGLIANAGKGGSFIDVYGSVKVTGRFYAGLVGTLSEGVLRVRGTTDLSAYNQHNASSDWTSGTIVRTRGRSLIYACGSGENAAWTLKRNTSVPNLIDDVYTWGEILRLDGTTLTENDLFTVDMTAHTVTVKSGVTAMSTVTHFAKTALNVQLGTAAVGALRFETANQSATLLSADLSLGADIDLAGTGLTGLTRDDGENGAFSGTFNGNGHTLSLATGEVWGLSSSGGALPAGSTDGQIRRHTHYGLFAKTQGATFTDLSLDGYVRFIQDVDAIYVGGLSAYATGALTLTDLDVTAITFDYQINSTYTTYVGGAVGACAGNSLVVTVSGGEYRPIVNDLTPADKYGSNNKTYVGGVIGYVLDGSGQKILFDGTTIGLTYTKTVNANRESCFGSAIAGTSNPSYVKGGRTIDLTDVTVKMSATGTAANRIMGGILGTEWLSADVTLDAVEINAASITQSNAAAADFGGLVRTATGRWDVKDLSVVSANFDVTATGSTFGLLANKSSSGASALYLELDNTETHYDVGGTNAVTFTGSTGNFTLFDEIVADTRFNGGDITRNGNSVVSIKTSGDALNVAGSYNSYLNKTAYGKTANGAVNPNARYYYNVGHAVSNLAVAKYNLFAWSVKQYAHPSLAGWFGSPSSTFAGTIDLTGISYYPVDLSPDVTFSAATVTLDNDKMQANVKYAYSGESGGTRSTRSASQHYLMHAALFLNATGDITASGSPAGLTLKGNVPKISDGICGFLVAGTLGGTDNPIPTEFNVTSLVLNGVWVSDDGDPFTVATYAPLLVNKIGRNTTVTLNGATQTGYTGALAGSSLFGDAGSSTAHGIRFTFSRIVFDARSASSTDLSSAGTTAMNNVYGTSKSIFSRATLLNSFLYAGESGGSYTFTIDEDWNVSTHAAIHAVTYGYEITSSVENAGKQNKYSGSETVYTDPETDGETGDPYDFTTYFLPYVFVTAAPAEYKHELSVNINYSSEIRGFGKYDSPYLIDSGEKLMIIARIIKGDDVTSSVKIQLPGDLTGFNYTATGYGQYLYTFGTSTFTSDDGGADRSNANVRRYLAGAYYAITNDIELPAEYEALGQASASNPEYAFHGVILGSGAIRKITNASAQPLIHTSTGCVLKNVTVHVATDVGGSHVITLSSGSTEYLYANGQLSYGALIRQIVGGDNIIDNVKVTFETAEGKAVTFSLSATGTNNYPRLIAIGGYVGTLVNGGLIFRNTEDNYSGLTAATTSYVSDDGWLYVNPIIGRVLAGYAFRETNAYAAVSEFSNGTKNYALSDLDANLSKLSIANSNDQYVVTIPNGQAMYVLGAIVNCGASSASFNDSNEQAYASLSDFWQAYRRWTQTRTGATYDGVGTASGADYTAASGDAYDASGALKGIPYVIRTYTQKNGNVYYARALTKRINTILSITGDCDVAAGFRGIGSIYSETNAYSSDRVHLGIASMTGTGNPTITLHMSFAEYDASVTSYRVVNGNTFAATEKEVMFGSNAGFGLFNRLYVTGEDYIEGFTLSGSVRYRLRQVSDGSASSCSYANVKGFSVLNVGALAGTAYSNSSSFYTSVRIRNVTLSGLSVEGPKYAGGLVGCFCNPMNGNEAKYVNYVTECPVSTLTVEAGIAAGSYFGYVNVGGNNNGANAARLIITGDPSLKTTVAPTEITVSGALDEIWERSSPAAGGLIGCADTAYAAGGDYYLQVRYIKVVGGTLTAPRTGEATYTNAMYQRGLPAAAGVVAKVRGTKMLISDCEILHVDLDADAVGGVLGCMVIPRDSTLTVERVTVDGDKGDSTKASMTSRLHAGGILGRMYTKNASTYTFADLTVKNYAFASEHTGNEGTAGGVVGNVYVETNNVKSFIFRNLEVTDCTMTVNTSTSGAGYRKGVGGLFGALSGSNSKTTYAGYNLRVADVTFAGSGTGNAGAILGNNVSNTAIVKLVGVSAVVTPGTKTLSFTENNNNGYAVCSDFSQVKQNTAFPGVNDTGTAADDFTDVAAAYPYATTNPAFTLGATTLTGEGFAASIEDLPIRSILAACGAGDRYAYAGTAYYTGNSGDTNYAAFNAVKNSALGMFSAETFGYGGTDFPILVIETTDENVSHKIINSYIRLLTNTKFDYGTAAADKYEVVIYKMEYRNGDFTFTQGDASLRVLGGKFRATNAAYDSGKIQCSLVDVRFFDPTGTGKVAYHLYVPVFVKKVLTYSFDVAALGSTSYLESQYTSLFGQRLIANVGEPITLYFRYTYSRTAAEWETAINAGETPHRNYGKELTLQKANNNDVLKDFDEDTVLILVDKNDGGKPYYARLGDALSGTTISLSAFRSVMTRDGEGDLQFSGDGFVPRDFADMLTLTVNSTGDGRTLVQENDPLLATVTVDGQGYRPATEEELEDGNVAKYSVSVGAIDGGSLRESYYLSIFTGGGANYSRFHYFIVTSPSALIDGVTYPARISDTDAHTMVHLVMGKIFDHTDLSLSSASKRGQLLMTSDNNALTATLSVRIGISSDLGELRDEVKGYVSATGFYQSFLLYLTRHEGNAQTKAILGDPTVTGSYAIDYVMNGTPDAALSAYDNADVRVTQTFAEFVTDNLGSAFSGAGNYAVEINATVTLTYALDGAVAAQFPGRNGEDENGVTLSADSNIAFSSAATSYSKDSIDCDDSSAHSYYSEADIENATLYCEPFGDSRGDFTPYGINALNDPPETLEALLTLDFTPIISQVRGQYADAVVTVSLRQKQDSGSYGNSDLPDITQYIPALSIGETAATGEGHASYYSAVIGASDLTEGDVTIEFPRLSFSVKTGAPFETGFVYSNYRMTVSVVLRDEHGEEIAATKCSDFMIYTNAKVVPSFIITVP